MTALGLSPEPMIYSVIALGSPEAARVAPNNQPPIRINIIKAVVGNVSRKLCMMAFTFILLLAKLTTITAKHPKHADSVGVKMPV